MIEKIIEMLKLTDHFGISEEIEIAKGKYKLTDNLKEIYKQEQVRRKPLPLFYVIEQKTKETGFPCSNYNNKQIP